VSPLVKNVSVRRSDVFDYMVHSSGTPSNHDGCKSRFAIHTQNLAFVGSWKFLWHTGIQSVHKGNWRDGFSIENYFKDHSNQGGPSGCWFIAI